MIEQDIQQMRDDINYLRNNDSSKLSELQQIRGNQQTLILAVQNLTTATNALQMTIDELQSVIFTKKITNENEKESNKSNESE